MKQKLILIARYMAMLLIVFSLILLIPAFVSLFVDHNLKISKAFFYTAIGSLILGGSVLFFFRNRNVRLTLANSMILCAFSWTFLSAVGALPFAFGLNKGFVDSFFEAVSGLTTTGITVFSGLDDLPFAIVLWRAIMQWVGGLGILTFFLFITTSNEGDMWHLFSAEGHKIASARPVPNVFRTVKILWAIYAAYTIANGLILLLLGLPLRETLLHALTTVSTGGFSSHDASIGYFEAAGYANFRLIEYTTIFFMFLGGMNFLVHYRMFRGDVTSFWTEIESRTYIKLIAIATSIILIGMAVKGQFGMLGSEAALRKGLFQVVSLITSTGFGTENIFSPVFPAVAQQVFFLLMIVGGSVGSTSGGIKVMRIVLLEKLFKREVRKITLPNHAVTPIVVDKTVMEESELTKVAALVTGWILFIIIGSFITAIFSDLDAFQAASGMTSAVGNMGPFFFSVETMIGLPDIVKITYAVGMLAGRLELLPLVVLITRRAWQ